MKKNKISPKEQMELENKYNKVFTEFVQTTCKEFYSHGTLQEKYDLGCAVWNMIYFPASTRVQKLNELMDIGQAPIDVKFAAQKLLEVRMAKFEEHVFYIESVVINVIDENNYTMDLVVKDLTRKIL